MEIVFIDVYLFFEFGGMGEMVIWFDVLGLMKYWMGCYIFFVGGLIFSNVV